MVLDTRKSDLRHMFTSRNAGAIESVIIAPAAPVSKTRKSPPRVTQCTKSPITVWYSARGVTPTRSVAYRAVTILADFGFATIGTINYAGKTRYVERTTGAWQLSCPIAPYIGRK